MTNLWIQDVNEHVRYLSLSGSTAGLVLNLLLGTLGLEGLSLSTTSLSLVEDLLVVSHLGFLLVDLLDEDTLVLEDVTFALHVEGAVKVLVNLLRVTVLLEETTEDTETTHPDHTGWHASLRATGTLTETGVATLALGGEVLADRVPGVNLGWLLDDEAILSKLTDVKA